jgi:hypothetical protein
MTKYLYKAKDGWTNSYDKEARPEACDEWEYHLCSYLGGSLLCFWVLSVSEFLSKDSQ